MQNKQLTISSSNITRCFLLFIVLLTIGIGLYGYNYTNAWLAEKKYTLNSIAEFVIDLVGHIAVGIDTLLQRTGNAVQRVLLFRQPGVGVVVTIQANADRQ
ncbi:hypothetical protein, partial [Serratia marcescens]|uniref:hypothetical protein n=1 Tax=Serratia marcescens TaxID=615 RepID=UPI001495E9FE